MKKFLQKLLRRLARTVYYWDYCPMDCRKDFRGIFLHGLFCAAISFLACVIFAALALIAL